MQKHILVDRHKNIARRAALDNNLSEDARHFLRTIGAGEENLMVLKALQYMDDCLVDLEDKFCKEHENELAKAKRAGEQQAMEFCQMLIDAALYFEKEPADQDNIADLLYEAKKADKYRENLKE